MCLILGGALGISGREAERGFAQGGQFIGHQLAPLAGLEAFEFERPHLDATELANFVPKLSHHAADLAVASFAQLHADAGAVAVLADEPEARGGSALGVIASRGVVEEGAFFKTLKVIGIE